MADDTTMGTSDVIATDHVTTLNGAAVTQSATSPKVQRVKVAYGDDGVSRDVSDAFPLPITGHARNVSVVVRAGTFRLNGAAASPTNLLTIENTTGSAVLVAVRRLRVAVSFHSTATAFLLGSSIRMYRGTTVPSGGTVQTLFATDTARTAPPANVIVRGPASADGTATAITYALPAGTPMYSHPHPTLQTAVGYTPPDSDMNPVGQDDDPVILRATESLLVAVVGNSAATIGYTCRVDLEVFTAR